MTKGTTVHCDHVNCKSNHYGFCRSEDVELDKNAKCVDSRISKIEKGDEK